MRFPRLPHFRLATLFLLIACLATYLGGYQHGRRAAFFDWQQSLPVTKEYPVAGILPAQNDATFSSEVNKLYYFLEESLNSVKTYRDISFPEKLSFFISGDRISISVPPTKVDDVELLLAKLRQLKQTAESKGQPFEIPSPLRQRAQWQP